MSIVKKIGLAIGLFAVVGVGLGLSGYISLDFVNQYFVEQATGDFQRSLGQAFVALVTIQSAFVFFLLGSVVSTISASTIAREAASRKEALLANGTASFIGFYVMVGIALVIMLLALGTGGGGGGGGGGDPLQIADILGPILKIGIPTGLVGVASGGILFELR